MAEFQGSATITATVRAATACARTSALAADVSELGDATVVDLLGDLEDLKAAAEAAQLRLVRALADRREAEEAERRRLARDGVRRSRRALGTCSELGLAMRCGPHRAERLLGTARALVEMPHTFLALVGGHLTPWRAQLLVRATAGVERDVRHAVDTELCADAHALHGVGDRKLEGRARSLVAELDPAGVARRRARAEADRRVTSRPLPDTMLGLSAVLPVAQGVSVVAALTRAADQARAAGDPRSRSQVMADTLVTRVTGQAAAEAVPVAVHLLVRGETLLGGGPGASPHVPGWLLGHGPLDAAATRDLLRTASGDATARAASWLRRLITAPGADGAPERLVAMDSRRRQVPDGLADFVLARDAGLCRTPWCDAPVRDTDHVVGHSAGGPTDEPNLQGLCQACNLAKQAPGWSHAPPADAAPERAGPHTVRITTPTGHRHTSCAPGLPGDRRPRIDLITRLRAVVLAA